MKYFHTYKYKHNVTLLLLLPQLQRQTEYLINLKPQKQYYLHTLLLV